MATVKKRKSKTRKRTVIEPNPGGKRYARRNKQGEFKKQVALAVPWQWIAA